MRKLFTLIFFQFLTLFSFGQVIFTIEDVTVCDASSNAFVQFSVENFNNITGMQFTIEWDESVIDLVDIDGYHPNLSGLDDGDFNTFFAPNGQTTLAWISGNGAGDSVPDGESIFTIEFSILGGPGSTSPVEINSSITPLLVGSAGPPPSQVSAMINPGSVTVGNGGMPTIACPANLNLTSNDGNPLTVNGLSATYSDACGTITTVTYQLTGATTGASPTTGLNDASGTTFNIGTTTVTYSATNNNNNSANCSFSVTVVDATDVPVIFTLGSENLACGASNVSVDVTVENFSQIAGLQYTHSWDNTMLDFISVDNFNPAATGLDASDFNLTNASNGDITLAWITGMLANIPDNEVLYTLNFNVLPALTSTVVALDGSVTPVFVGQGSPPMNAQTTINNATVAITGNGSQAPVLTCPNDVIMANDAGECSAVVTFPDATVMDDCDMNLMATVTSGLASGDTFPVGVMTVEFSATDSQNQTGTCTFTVTVFDDEAPVLTCPADINQGVDMGECGAVINFAPAAVTDNCDGNLQPAQTAGLNSGDLFPIGTTTVTFARGDSSGNIDECSFTVTITDDEHPVISNCTPAVPPVMNDPNECSAVVNFTHPTATDNCGPVTTTASHNSGDAFPIGNTTVTFTFTDNDNNVSTCNFTVTVTENEDPIITCPADISMAASATECSAMVTWNDATATDNCGSATVTNTSTFNSGDEISVGATTITYEAEDAAGNTATCDFIITIFDETGPVFNNCPTDFTVQTTAGMCTAMGNWTEPTADDNCGNVMSLSANANSDDPLPIGDTTIVYTATDSNGNTSECSFVVTIEDGQAPTIADCPTDILNVPNDAGTCGAVITYAEPTATDDCGMATISCSTASGATFPVGTTPVTCTATDDSGNTAICEFTVMVEDTENPTITCPASQTIAAGMGNITAVVNNITPTVADNCGIDTTFYVLTGATTGDGANDASGSTFNLGETTITYTTIDNSDSTATCDFTITVIDDTDLILNCPNNATAFTTADSCGATVLNIAPDASPMSEVASITYETTGATVTTGDDDASGIFYNIGETTVIYTATDNDGNMLNCSFLVTVNDTIMPVLTDCPADISINVLPNTCANTATWTAPTATDNCPNLNMTSTHNPGDEFIVGNTVVSYLAADASGNQTTCSFTITVMDNINPTINNCPPPIEIFAENGDCSAMVTWTEPTVSDNCPGATISSNNDPDDTFSLGINEVIYIASDASGNQASCSFTINVIDNQMPEISDCPANITVPAEGADCSATVTWTEPTATDNCPDVFLSGNPASGSIFPTGTTTVNYIATDFSGNTAECSFTVTVEDNNAPITTFCPPSMTEDAIPNECSATVTWTEPTFEDDCGVTSVVASHTSGEMYMVSGPITVVYTASDAAGNTANCVFTIEVLDNQPVVIFPDLEDLTVNNDPGQCSAIVNYVAPQAFDNCGVTGFVTTHPSGSEFPVGTTTVSWTASDAAGNVTVESFNITVIDNEPPKPVCPENIEITVDGTNLSDPSGSVISNTPVDCDNIFIEITEPTVTDNCTMTSFEQTEGNAFTNGTPFPIGTTLIEYTAMDASGNESTCAFNVIVNAVEFPAVNLSSIFPCEGDDFIAQVATYPNATFNWFDGNGELVSTGSAFSISEIMLSDASLYTIEMTLPTCVLNQQFQLTVFEKPEVEASANDILCTDGNQDLNLTATIQNGVTVSEWEWYFNGTLFSNQQNPTIEDATQAHAGQYIVQAITENPMPNGCLSADTIIVNISTVAQMPTITADQETTCIGTTINLNGQSYFGNQVEYIWNADPMQGSGLLAVNNFNTTATPTQAGTYIYTFSAIVDGCATDEAQVTVTVEEPPVLDVQVMGDLTCVDGSTSMTLLAGFSNSNATYLWTLNNNFLADTENVTVENINPTDDNGNYKIIVTLPNGCASEAAIDIEITTQPASPNEIEGVDSACLGESVTFTGTDYGPDATYIWLLNGAPISNSNSPIVTVSSADLGNNTVSFSATLNECNSGTVFHDLLIENAPVADLQIDGETTCLSGNTPLTLVSNNNDAATSFWLNENNVQVATTADFTIENANAGDSGEYYFVMESAIGCQNIDTINIQITDGLPQIEAMLIGQPCEDGNLTLSSTEIQNATYTWTNPKGENFSSAQSPLVALASTEFNGMYTVTATADGCSTTDSVMVEILEAPTAIDDEFAVITNTATPFDVLLNDGFDGNQAMTVSVLQSTSQGTLTQLNNGTFSYTPKEGSLETDMFAYQICYDACPNTCDIAFVELNVQFPTDNCTATTVITPNGDGINDRFVVFCLDVQEFPENELVIYGSWGDEIFRMTGYDNSWKGTYENEPLPDGTYYYIFKREPNAEAEKGFVMIYR